MPIKRTVIFWGAGATATLGMRTTAYQGKFLRDLATGKKNLKKRVECALGYASRTLGLGACRPTNHPR